MSMSWSRGMIEHDKSWSAGNEKLLLKEYLVIKIFQKLGAKGYVSNNGSNHNLIQEFIRSCCDKVFTITKEYFVCLWNWHICGYISFQKRKWSIIIALRSPKNCEGWLSLINELMGIVGDFWTDRKCPVGSSNN